MLSYTLTIFTANKNYRQLSTEIIKYTIKLLKSSNLQTILLDINYFLGIYTLQHEFYTILPTYSMMHIITELS